MTSKIIYTSNYARKGADPKALAISAWPPPWYKGKGLNILAPTRQMVYSVLKGEVDMETYKKQYLLLLDKRIDNPQKLIDEIPDGAYLLCYEKPTDLCHRHMLRDWIYEKTGFKMIEWMNEHEFKQAEQQDIVESLVDM